MPFICDTHCCGVTRYEVTFNVDEICLLIEDITKKTYRGAINEESWFWVYVGSLEELYSVHFSKNFKKFESSGDWLTENYDTIVEWDNIKDNFEDDEEEEEKNIN